MLDVELASCRPLAWLPLVLSVPLPLLVIWLGLEQLLLVLIQSFLKLFCGFVVEKTKRK
jgi:hypothetical protein